MKRFVLTALLTLSGAMMLFIAWQSCELGKARQASQQQDIIIALMVFEISSRHDAVPTPQVSSLLDELVAFSLSEKNGCSNLDGALTSCEPKLARFYDCEHQKQFHEKITMIRSKY